LLTLFLHFVSIEYFLWNDDEALIKDFLVIPNSTQEESCQVSFEKHQNKYLIKTIGRSMIPFFIKKKKAKLFVPPQRIPPPNEPPIEKKLNLTEKEKYSRTVQPFFATIFVSIRLHMSQK